MQDKIFYSACLGFVAGVLLRSFWMVNLYVTLWLAGLTVAIALIFLLSKNKWLIIFCVFLFAFFIGIWRFSLAEFTPFHSYDQSLGQEISSEGKIIDAPDIRENNQKLLVEEDISGIVTKILITTNLNQSYKYGDIINFSGKIEKPQNFLTDTGKEFDYVNYLRKDGIYYVMNYADIEIVSRGNGNKLKSVLFDIKEKFLGKINFAIGEPENLLMGGLILGEKSSFSQDLRQSFIDTGTIHIVALSGYNVTIVAEWIMKLFKSFPHSWGIGMGVLSIFLFIIMTGASSTAIRAGIMATLALFARATGRNYDAGRALLLAGVGMILFNPFLLAFDVSFQLSFIATVAVIFLAPKIEKYFTWVTKTFELRDIVSVTCAAYIFVLPFILYKMGNLSLVALPANILILPLIPFTMLLGFLTGFFGLLWYGLAVPLGFVSYLFLHYELLVINFFSRLPFASFAIPNFPMIFTILIYAWFIYKLFGRSIKSSLARP
jgi:competence protein ComEC